MFSGVAIVRLKVITNLDIDTWKEVNRNQGFAKCGSARHFVHSPLRVLGRVAKATSLGMLISSGSRLLRTCGKSCGTCSLGFVWPSPMTGSKESNSPFMPVLSGGLLGISKRWWNETGGGALSHAGTLRCTVRTQFTQSPHPSPFEQWPVCVGSFRGFGAVLGM